ncbi:MAG: ATP-binding protein [Desulfitobacteriaceae bacterium]
MQEESNREELVLRIQDTGCGFPVEEKLKQIEHKMRDPALIEDDAWVESGRGLLIMRAVADRLKFSRLGNRVSLYISLTPKSDLNARPG